MAAPMGGGADGAGGLTGRRRVQSFLRVMAVLFRIGLSALVCLIAIWLAFHLAERVLSASGFFMHVFALAVMAFTLAALWNIGQTRRLWEIGFKLLLVALLIFLAWFVVHSAYLRGDLRVWYEALAVGTILLLLAIALWPFGRSIFFEKSWSGLLIALLFVWGFALVPFLIDQMPLHCSGRIKQTCELMNRLHASGGPWFVLGIYFSLVFTYVYYCIESYLDRRGAEQKRLQNVE
jgi:hypothetical protein